MDYDPGPTHVHLLIRQTEHMCCQFIINIQDINNPLKGIKKEHKNETVLPCLHVNVYQLLTNDP